MLMMAVPFPRYNSRTMRHKTFRVYYDIYIGYPVLIIPHQHDEKYELTWSCQILIIFRSTIPWSYQWHILTLACNICCYSFSCFVLMVPCKLQINMIMSGSSYLVLSSICWHIQTLAPTGVSGGGDLCLT